MKRKRDCSNSSDDKHLLHHRFSQNEIEDVQNNLLAWYDENQRTLPWRSIARDEKDDNVRGYAVWVSEVMLQQTQVATVVDYYKKWMKKWPNMQKLSQASLEEVNEAWSGLGYYSRGKRLWEGAQKIVNECGGQLPQEASELQSVLPGVGKYTASAIASIAFGKRVGLVDGNVCRVISRMRKIGADINGKEAMTAFWNNAEALVSQTRPGDFNQGLMELGATICTPKTPQCSKCPVKNDCQGAKAKDIEDYFCDSEQSCSLCLPRQQAKEFNNVLVFPHKEKRTKVSEKTSVVCVLKHGERICLLQRPETGLLANLYEFPSLLDWSEDKDTERVQKQLKATFGVKADLPRYHGDITHQFSHICQKYMIWSSEVPTEDILAPDGYQKVCWVEKDAIMGKSLAISTAMKKVFQFYEKESTKKKCNQRSIMHFLTRK